MVIIGLGTNLGNHSKNLAKAVESLKTLGTVIKQSHIYESEPWGYNSQHLFSNQVIELDTDLSPVELLQTTQAIEKDMGRESKTGDTYTDRIMDIDLIAYDNLIFDSPRLKLPHPLMHLRNFVLVPLCEILPQWKHPVFNKTAKQLLDESLDKSNPIVKSETD